MEDNSLTVIFSLLTVISTYDSITCGDCEYTSNNFNEAPEHVPAHVPDHDMG